MTLWLQLKLALLSGLVRRLTALCGDWDPA